jgi:hypothetical protein
MEYSERHRTRAKQCAAAHHQLQFVATESSSSSQLVCKYEGSNYSVCSSLVAGTEYLFAIRALNMAGQSYPMNVFKVALGTCIYYKMCVTLSFLFHFSAGFPSQIPSFVARVIEPLSILLEWTKPMDTGLANQMEPLSYYNVIMSKSNLTQNVGGFTDVLSVFNGSCNATTCTTKQMFSSSSVLAVLPYYFRSQLGYNSSSFAEARDQSIFTPSSPVNVQARVTGIGLITLSWTPLIDTGVGDASRSLLDFLVSRTKRNSNLSCSCFCPSCDSCLNCVSCNADAGACCNLTLSAALSKNYSTVITGMPTGPSLYYFAIAARNDAGYGFSSTIAN